MSEQGILSDVRVLDLGSAIAAPLASMLLAEAGADVIKVEPPTGDPARPLPGFSVWNRSKRSVVVDVNDPDDRRAFEAMLAGADVLVHDLPARDARERGWDAESLAARHPGLIVCGVPPYPIGHPDEDRSGDDSLVFARMGLMDEQQGVQEGPIYIRLPFASFCSAWLAAAGVVARLVGRDRTGHAGPASTSLMQGALVPMTMHWARAGKPSDAFALGMPKSNVPTLFECGDGVWLHVMRPPEQSPLMRRELEAMGDARIAELDAAGPKMPLAPHFGANIEAFKRHDSATWLEDLWANDVPVQAAVPLGEIYFDEQAIANDYVVAVEDPVLGKLRQPGHAYTTEPPARIQGPAPRLGAHDQVIRDEIRKRRVLERSTGDPTTPPLAGIRVLDFGNFLAGPLAPMLLADLGANVVKVEATTGDMMRPIARVFDGCQRGKRGIAIDLKHAKARSVLERLVAGCDVVHHNLRMPAALRLGLGYDALREIRPDLVYCHVSSYGPRGPRKDWPGFDQLFQAQSGWEYEGAGEGNPPMWHRFGMMDHQCALASLFATLLGIRQRDRTGEGQFVSASLLGASLLSVSETVVLPEGRLAPFERLDAQQMGVSPSHRLFVCRDGWIAVAAPNSEAIAAALGEAHANDLESAFTRLAAAEALDSLERSGIAAEPVRLDQMETFLDSEAHRSMGLSVRYPHAEYEWTEQIGGLWNMGPARLSIDRAAPTLGEHTREILDQAGFAAAEIAALIEEGVIAARS